MRRTAPRPRIALFCISKAEIILVMSSSEYRVYDWLFPPVDNDALLAPEVMASSKTLRYFRMRLLIAIICFCWATVIGYYILYPYIPCIRAMCSTVFKKKSSSYPFLITMRFLLAGATRLTAFGVSAPAEPSTTSSDDQNPNLFPAARAYPPASR